MIEEQLHTIITANAGVAALVGKRVRPMRMKDNDVLPLIVYEQTDGQHLYTHDGDTDLCTPRYQFSCYATTYAGVKALASALNDLLSGYSNRTLTVPIHAAFLETEMDMYDPDAEAYRVILTYKIWHEDV